MTLFEPLDKGRGPARGLAVWPRGDAVTHATLTLESDALVIDAFDIGGLRRRTRSRLIRRDPSGAADSQLSTQLSRFERAVANAYEAEFNEGILRPSVYRDPTDLCGKGINITSTAFLKVSHSTSNLLILRVSELGTVVRKARRTVFTPAGRIQVLAVLVHYPETVGDRGQTLWHEAQESINRDHEMFARSRGYASPLVVFENKNVTLARSLVGDPRRSDHIRRGVELSGIRVSDYDFVLTVDLDPESMAGGEASVPLRSVYVGNYRSSWRSPLNGSDWRDVAKTAYHHEVAHLWGWEHEWSPVCADAKRVFDPFVGPPALFGWDDTDGDGVAEILDPSPYGRKP